MWNAYKNIIIVPYCTKHAFVILYNDKVLYYSISRKEVRNILLM
jgi:(2Fe-2S) ferredoxin